MGLFVSGVKNVPKRCKVVSVRNEKVSETPKKSIRALYDAVRVHLETRLSSRAPFDDFTKSPDFCSFYGRIHDTALSFLLGHRNTL